VSTSVPDPIGAPARECIDDVEAGSHERTS
jgi:hypothetical protein